MSRPQGRQREPCFPAANLLRALAPRSIPGGSVPGFGFRVSGFGFRVSGFWFRVSGLGFRVPGSGFRILCFGFRVQGFVYQVKGIRLNMGVYAIGQQLAAPIQPRLVPRRYIPTP